MASMDSLIQANKRKSMLLVLCMGLILAALGVSIGVAVHPSPEAGLVSVVIAVIVTVVMFLGSYYGGASLIMAASGAKQISKQDHQELWNVVEEMCIAANMPLPAIYIIEDSAPNAFATGRDPDNAAVAITTGLLQKLDRDELQGVMAHELAHVQNLDIRLMMLMAVMVGSIALLADMMWRTTMYGGMGRRRRRSSGGGGKGNQAQVIALVVAIILAILAPIAARILMMAVSREREYLADATAAKMTHYPEGLMRALAKISGDQDVLEAANRGTQHLYIINPIKAHEARFSGMMSTHPPVKERIERLNGLVGKV